MMRALVHPAASIRPQPPRFDASRPPAVLRKASPAFRDAVASVQSVRFGSHVPAKPFSADLDAMVDAYCDPNPRGFRQALGKTTGNPDIQVAHFNDTAGRGEMLALKRPRTTKSVLNDLTHLSKPAEKPLIWLDLFESDSDLLDEISHHFSFVPVEVEESEDRKLRFEKPFIDHDSIQLTVYGLSLSDDQKDFVNKPIRIYAGDNFVVTAHDGPRKSLQERRDSLLRSDATKTTTDLVSSLVEQLVLSNGQVIKSIATDIDELAQTIEDKSKLDAPETKDAFLRVLRKIGHAGQVLQQQQEVLYSFNIQNKDFNSELLDKQQIQESMVLVEKQAEFVRNEQMRLATLEGIQGTEIGNRLNKLMRRGSVVLAPLAIQTVVSGYAGMNTIGNPPVFWGTIALSVLSSVGGVVWAWKKRWI